jgi:signal transduction histidine kinase/ligand-binding sensor domain-containing protein/CheY-like chemotaxis protein
MIWIATEGGLARYDGFEVRAMEPATWGHAGSSWEYFVTAVGTVAPERRARRGAEGMRPVVWVGTDGKGLVRYDPEADRADVVEAGRFSHPAVRSVLATSEGLWIGTEAGLDFLGAGRGEFAPVASVPGVPAGRVPALVQDAKGRVWVAVEGKGLFRRGEDGTWMWVSTHPDVVVLASAGQDGLAVATRGRLVMLDAESGEERAILSSAEEGAGPAAEGIRSLVVDRRQTLWAGTEGGLWSYRTDEGSWIKAEHRPDIASSLPPGAVTALIEDRGQDVLLVATSEGQVARHRLTSHWFPIYQKGADPDGMPGNAVDAFASAGEEGGVWVATDAGLCRFDPEGETFRRFPEWDLEEFRRGAGPVLEDRQGRLWAGAANGGLWMADLNGDRVPRRCDLGEGDGGAGTAREEVAALLEDREGSVWAAVRGKGVFRRGPGDDRFRPLTLGTEEAPVRHVNALAEGTDGGVWIASITGGLWYWPAGANRAIHYRELTGVDFELPSDNVTGVLVGRNGVVWAATVGAGLCKLTFPDGRLEVFGRQNRKLPHWVIYGMTEDDEGNLWMSTGAGLVRLDAKTEETRVFGPHHGIQGTSFSPRAALRTAGGELLFGGARGFNRVDPAALPDPDPAPVAVLVGLELYGEPVFPEPDGVLRKPLALTDRLDLPFDRRMRVAIRFGTLGDSGTRPVRYRFRLNGFEKDWVAAGEETKALYTGLRPGAYEFEVQASPDGETWGAATARLPVRVVPPWPHSWWARGLYVVAALGMLWGGIWYHGRERSREEATQRQRLENERNQAETALSRQLQQSMLLERTSSALRRGLDGRQVFEAALQRVATHFQACRCFLLSVDEANGGEAEWVAGYVANRVGDRNPEEMPWKDHPLVKRALASAAVVRGGAESEGVRSAIAIRTTHLDAPNGVLLLHQCDRERVWEAEEEKLLQAVSAQFGMALAQFLLAQREAEQRLELEAARQAADEANRAKSEFLAKMTHELRTPLNAIIGFSEIMSLDESLDPRFREHLDIINSSGEHLLGVISDVLEVSKIEAGKAELVLERFDLDKLLRSVHGMFSVAAAGKGIGLELIPLGTFPEWLEADKGKLRQILINLVGNAIKFTRHGGVALRAGVQSAGKADESGRREVRLVLEVSDTGPGIAAGEEEKLFQKFVQTRTGLTSQQGTGLGLAIVKGFAELMGGEVEVISRQGYGSLFRVEVPCAAWESGAEVAVAEPERGHVVGLAPGERPRRILVAEDQSMNRLLLNRLLSKVGFEWREVENGELAVQAYREFLPELILMDEDMPRLRGTQAARIILDEARRLGEPEPKIVSLTAFSLEEQRQAARQAGCHGFLSKPFKREELFGLIGDLLGVRYVYSRDSGEERAVA